MAENYVDYEVLEKGKSVYGKQAEAIQDTLQTLIGMNSELESGWKNLTASAFLEKFETVHKPALESARDALQGIADYISNYSANRQDEDRQNASNIG